MYYGASIGDELTGLLGSVANVALRVIIFFLIMALGWFVAAWLRRWVARGLQRVGFDRVVERGGLGRVLGSTSASVIAAQLVFFAFMLFVLQLAFGIFGANPVSDLISSVVRWLPRLFVAIIIVVVAAAIAGWVKELITNGLGALSYGRMIGTAAQVLILTLGIMAALNQVGVATSVTLPVLITVLATIGGILIVGMGGGLIKPMQHRWERWLNRAESETSLAAEKIRTQRAATADRNANVPTGFDQPAYGGSRADDTKPIPTPTDAENNR